MPSVRLVINDHPIPFPAVRFRFEGAHSAPSGGTGTSAGRGKCRRTVLRFLRRRIAMSAIRRGRRVDDVALSTPSTRFAYSQVFSRAFASFRVVRFDVSAGQRHFCSGFDSRQLHHERPWSGVVPKIIGRLTRHQTAVRVLITAGAGAAGRLVDGHEFLFGPSGRAVAELDLDLARIGKRGQIPLCGGPRYADLRG